MSRIVVSAAAAVVTDRRKKCFNVADVEAEEEEEAETKHCRYAAHSRISIGHTHRSICLFLSTSDAVRRAAVQLINQKEVKSGWEKGG